MSLETSTVERPDIARAFAHLAGANAPTAPASDPIATMRAFVDRYGDVEARPDFAKARSRHVLADGVPAEWVLPDGPTAGGRIVLLHGGGWVAGGLDSHRPIAAALSDMTGSPVLMVDYRLAPEHPFPAGFDDCVAALAWAGDNGPDAPSRAERLYLVGDSAGGNLAAAVCQHIAHRGGRMPDRLVLMSAALDGSPNPARGPSDALEADQAALASMMGLYVQDASALADPRVSPLNAPASRLAKFPPTLLQASNAEFLLWDATAMTSRMTEAGATAKLSVWPGMPHVWQAFLTLLPEARQALAEIAGFLASSRGV